MLKAQGGMYEYLASRGKLQTHVEPHNDKFCFTLKAQCVSNRAVSNCAVSNRSVSNLNVSNTTYPSAFKWDALVTLPFH